ncbi:hypothetical protein MMC24_001998 [Lignoscripta atroalba]|nr:hypothetical protein [Lignoscripta atroalba]
MNAQSLSYFDAYEGFTPKPHETVEKEFNRLANIRGWIAGTKKYHQEHRRCLYSEFDTHVGMIVVDDNLNSWQSLCLEVGVSTIPGSITQCKKALKKVHVNLVDLIDSRRRGLEVKSFPSYQALRTYTIEQNKFFPKARAKRDGVLKILLKEIF